MIWNEIYSRVQASEFFMARDEVAIDLETVALAIDGATIHPLNFEASLKSVIKVARVLAPEQVASKDAEALFRQTTNRVEQRFRNMRVAQGLPAEQPRLFYVEYAK